MGSQQILLIVLGTITVGIALFSGINLYYSYVKDSNRDQVYTSLYQIADMAIAYYKKPTEVGGGGGSFAGFSLPQNFSKNDVGRFQVNANSSRINITGRGVEIGRDGKKPIRLILRVKPSDIILTDRN